MPAAATPAVIAGVVLAGPIQAGQSPVLPAKTAEQVLALAAGSHVTAFSGTLTDTVNLGLPQLPSAGPGSGGSDSALGGVVAALSTPQTAKVFVDGAGNQRLQIMDTLAERDVVRHGLQLWTYDSATNSATLTQLPNPKRPGAMSPDRLPGPVMPGPEQVVPGPIAAPSPKTVTPGPVEPIKTVPHVKAPDPVFRTPASIAHELITALDPSTTVRLGPTVMVAKQKAYDLQLIPHTTGTLVGMVQIAVDANNGMPLRVSVTARGADGAGNTAGNSGGSAEKAAFELGFTQLTLKAPPASVFAFTPPPGTSITHNSLPLTVGIAPAAAMPGVTTLGTGWTSIIKAPAGTVPAATAASPALARLLRPVDGGHALTTSLFSVLITDDGGLYAGAVPLAALQSAAAAAR